MVVGAVDGLLRRYHHVYEFSDAPSCVFRVSLGRARKAALLSDGTAIKPGDPIGLLHCWNERIYFPPGGPDLHWAKGMHRRVQESLEALCRHVEAQADWARVNAIHAETALPIRLLDSQQMQRIVRHHGFETGARRDSASARLCFLADNILMWSFARAYNPPALPRHHLLQGRQELWLSRKALLAARSRAASGRA